jgi:hypothetical protein
MLSPLSRQFWFDRPSFNRYRWIWLAISAALLVINVATFAGWLWAFWPIFVLGLPLFVQFLIVRSMAVDDEWVDERILDLHMNSYDFDHIRNIKEHGPGSAGQRRVSQPPDESKSETDH